MSRAQASIRTGGGGHCVYISGAQTSSQMSQCFPDDEKSAVFPINCFDAAVCLCVLIL